MWRWTHVQSILYFANTVIQKICFRIKKNVESTHMVFVWGARITLAVKFQIPSAPCYSMNWACPSITLGRSIMALGFIPKIMRYTKLLRIRRLFCRGAQCRQSIQSDLPRASQKEWSICDGTWPPRWSISRGRLCWMSFYQTFDHETYHYWCGTGRYCVSHSPRWMGAQFNVHACTLAREICCSEV